MKIHVAIDLSNPTPRIVGAFTTAEAARDQASPGGVPQAWLAEVELQGRLVHTGTQEYCAACDTYHCPPLHVAG